MIDKLVLSRFSPVVLLATAVLFGFALPAFGQGQNMGVSDTTATPVPGVPHDYLVGLNEIVSPSNGSLSIRIKAPAPHERGVNWPRYLFMWDSANQYGLSPFWVDGTTPNGQGWADFGLTGVAQTTYFGSSYEHSVTLPTSSSSGNSTATYWCDISSGYVYTDPDGGNHGMGLVNAQPGTGGQDWDCSKFNIGENYTTGGDEQYKAYLNTTPVPAVATVVDLHGNVVTNQGSAQQFEDTNGNYINTTGRSWISTTTPTGGTFSVPGTTGSYVYTTEPIVDPSFPLPVNVLNTPTNGTCQIPSIPMGPLWQGTPPGVTKSIQQPDGQSYTFTYDPVYGLINSITYPTGATVSYTWGIIPNMEGVEYRETHGNGGLCELTYGWFAIVGRIVSYNGAPQEIQSFSYNTNWPAPGTKNSYGADISYEWTSKTTTVTTYDMVRGTSNQTVYTYLPALPPPTVDVTGSWGDQGYIPVENTITYIDTNGTSPLKTITKVWEPDSTSTLAAQCETLPNGQTSGTFYQYQPDTGFTGMNPMAYMTNLPTDVAVYDYGKVNSACANPNPAGTIPSPTAIHETVTTYASLGATPLFPYPSMLDRPQSVQVYGNGTLLSETDYAYDQYTQFPLTVVTPAPLGQDPQYATASITRRGNPTTVTKKCFAGSTNCTNSVTNYTYDTTGQVTSVIDACANGCPDMTPGAGHTTTYSYHDNYTTDDGTVSGNTNAYVTQITRPATSPTTHTGKYQYGYNDGRLRNATDVENATTTTYCYWTGGCSGSAFDPFFRLTGINHPDGGQETVAYSDAGPQPSVTVSTLLSSGNPLMVNETIYDGYGHPTDSELLSAPGGPIDVHTTYDGLGQVLTKSNPYRTTSDPTYGISSYYYDALGRQVEEVEQDGSVLQTCYDNIPSTFTAGNCSGHLGSVTTGPWVDSTDEVGNHWQRTSNVLGQLMDVMEPNGTTQAPTMETDYTYDALSNLLSVNQWGGASGSAGARKRTFTYDSLSRLLTSNNPETGTVSYSYDANGNLSTKTSPLVNATSGTQTVSYMYDNLNRLYVKSYSSGDPSAFMQYDRAASGGSDPYPDGRLTLEWTGPASTAPASSTALTSIPSAAYSSTTVLLHDKMGRLKSEQQCPLAPCASAYLFAYSYDLAGNVISSNNGMPTATNSTTAPAITWGAAYDAASRLSQVTAADPWTNTSLYPQVLFQAGSSTNQGYDPMGHLINAQLSLPTASSTTPGITQTRNYDNRGRILAEVDNGAAAASPATHSLGSIAITGTEQGTVYPASAYATATLSITGSEGVKNASPCNDPQNPSGGCPIYDFGWVYLTVDGDTVSYFYQQSDTASSVASSLAASANGLGLPIRTSVSGSTITFKCIDPGTAANGIPIGGGAYTTNPNFNGASYSLTPYGTGLGGGTNVAPLTWDAGTVSAKVSGATASVSYGSGSTPQSIASALATAIQAAAGGTVTASTDGDSTVLLASTGTGSMTDYSVSASATDSASYTPSFTATAFGKAMADGENTVSGATTSGAGSITVSGTEAGPIGSPATSGTGTVTISGSEQMTTVRVVCGPGPTYCNEPGVPDQGVVTIAINGVGYGGGYSNGSTPASIASGIAASINGGSLASATVGGATITITAKTTGTSSNYSLSPSVTYLTSSFSSPSFTASPAGSALTGGGAGASVTVYDAGTATVTITNNSVTPVVNYTTAAVSWGRGDTDSTVATRVASAINSAAGSIVSATASGSAITIQSTGTGVGTNYAVSTSIADTQTASYPALFPNPSFSANSINLTGGKPAGSSYGTIYSYYVPGGYAPNGNLLASSDSVMGDWLYNYDTLNRLTTAKNALATSTAAQYANAAGCWSYDPFGNRKQEAFSTVTNTPCASGANDNLGTPVSRTYTALNQDTGFTYDAAGNVTYDGLNTYLYDGEGRLCAVKNGVSSFTEYVYDAGGTRVAKGALSAWPASCGAPTAGNGFALTNQYLLGLGGDAVTELNGTGIWQHSNAHAGSTMATYALSTAAIGLEFQLTDPLGTRRILASANGTVVQTCQSLPYGDSETCPPTPTEQLFTGKERDTESGNDYFEARYYASAMGRFLSADPLPWIHWQHGDDDDQKKFAAYIQDPQNLNMYAYVTNNPLGHTDPTGMSDLIFDGQAHTITLVSKDGQVIGTWKAGNNVAIHAPPGEGGGAYTHGPIQDGTYSVAGGDQHGATTHLNGSPDSAFGANGIIHIPDAKGATGDTLSGAGVHSGREDKGGPDAKTAGCIRTTDEAMSTINSTAKSDPLKTVTVQNNSQNVQQWNATAAAVKKKDGQQ